MTIEIENGFKPPVSAALKKRNEHLTELKRSFKRYADAYEHVYVRRPVLLEITKSDMFRIDVLPQAVNRKRLKQLASMLRERAKDL